MLTLENCTDEQLREAREILLDADLTAEAVRLWREQKDETDENGRPTDTALQAINAMLFLHEVLNAGVADPDMDAAWTAVKTKRAEYVTKRAAWKAEQDEAEEMERRRLARLAKMKEEGDRERAEADTAALVKTMNESIAKRKAEAAAEIARAEKAKHDALVAEVAAEVAKRQPVAKSDGLAALEVKANIMSNLISALTARLKRKTIRQVVRDERGDISHVIETEQ